MGVRGSGPRIERRRRGKNGVTHLIDDSLAPRSCGECHGCCSGPEIAELGKRQFETCAHLEALPSGGLGCGIYEARPESCRRYLCLWLAHPELLREDERPDRIGVYFTLNPSKYDVSGEVTRRCLDAWESVEGGIDSTGAQAVVARLLDHASGTDGHIEGIEVVRFGDPTYYWIAAIGGISVEQRRDDLAGDLVAPFERRAPRRRLTILRSSP
jgi:hypothetical protein